MFFVPVYILILAFTIVIDYVAGILIENADSKKKKLYLIVSLISNIGILAVFKYYNFFVDNINDVFVLSGVNFQFAFLKILLPIGLSFHTFQAMSYTIEVYRGNQKAERHFGIYALYVMFFPQLVAGPIERPQNMLHQFHIKHKFDFDLVRSGLNLMFWGFFKKMVIADRLTLFVDPVFANPVKYGGLPILFGMVFFAFQIYCDFSGYSDIAIGAARIMGFKLMTNFNFPFISKNITEFWRKWHISLSTWFNDYLFNPLVIKTRNWHKLGVCFALISTLLISGLWHGAGWNFVIFGGLHGIAMTYEFLTKKIRKSISKALPDWIYGNISIVLTFMFACFAWIFFRAKSLKMAWAYIKRIPGLSTFKSYHSFNLATMYDNNISYIDLSIAIIGIFALFIGEYLLRKKPYIDEHFKVIISNLKPVFYFIALVFFILTAVFNDGKQFIYFQF